MVLAMLAFAWFWPIWTDQLITNREWAAADVVPPMDLDERDAGCGTESVGAAQPAGSRSAIRVAAKATITDAEPVRRSSAAMPGDGEGDRRALPKHSSQQDRDHGPDRH